MEMWENRHEYPPTWEEIIVPELACVPEYMPWFRIHGKSYLLTPEERQRQIRGGRERRGPLNPRRQDYEGSPSTRPRHSPGSSSAAMQSPSPTRAPTQSPDAAIQQMIPTQSPFPMMPGVFPSPYMYPNPYMYPFPNPMPGWSQMPGSAPFPVMLSEPPITRPAVQEGSQGGPSWSSHFSQSPVTHGFQTPSPFMMQTPPHTLFFEGGPSSHVRQPDAEPEEQQSAPEEEQPPPEARGRKNPARNRRRPPCEIESPGHRH
ncbi:uncharacterized protein LOC128041949 [Gossypium raimondii]|uniref:uncharacterized protein LOC128041949 n=1 Tax=Gossypium raimondii TaxID=29730 RepID=UPI00227B2FFB|nr:uncharacterized protein LOC128041949 [Gossypium raimondii]